MFSIDILACLVYNSLFGYGDIMFDIMFDIGFGGFGHYDYLINMLNSPLSPTYLHFYTKQKYNQ